MIKIRINSLEFWVKSDISVLEACKYVGTSIPRFCYHETLSVAGNCRMCLVEIEKSPKPVASCALPILNNMQIYVDTPLVKKARENVLGALLLNHPLDCPICDQAGECDLQDQTKLFGSDFSPTPLFSKRKVEDKECGTLIRTVMTRCIHCTRCIRFATEVAGVEYLGTLNRGGSTEIGAYRSSMFSSEISANVIDLCPVGALTSKPYAFKARPWEIKIHESIDLTDSTGSNMYVQFKESEILRILPKHNSEINGSIISDKARFSYDALKNQRVQRIFRSSNNEISSVKFEKTSWDKIFSVMDNIFSVEKKKVIVVVEDRSDIEFLSILVKFANTFKAKAGIRILGNGNFEDNSIRNVTKDKISDIKKQSRFCFILSSNLRIESVILNTKLRAKFLSENLTIISSGLNFNSNLPIEFVNLGTSNLLKIFEGKMLQFSKFFFKERASLFFISDNLKKRFRRSGLLLLFIKKLMPSSIVVTIEKSCNSSGAALLNIKSLNRRDVLVSEILMGINLNDNISLRTNFYRYTKALIFWFSSHSSQISTSRKNKFIIPITSTFESEGTFLNLEDRPQRCLKTFSSVYESRHVNDIFRAIGINSDQFKFLNFIYEILKMPQLFFSLKSKLVNVCHNTQKNSRTLVSLYPIKSSSEDFYTSGSFNKESSTMQRCSRQLRKSSTNF
jgi:NADH-quinone oxidoreductase chain G